jgi:hypothetical protein
MMTSDVLAMTARPAVMAFQDLDSAELALVEGGAINPIPVFDPGSFAVGVGVGVGLTLGGLAILLATGVFILV